MGGRGRSEGERNTVGCERRGSKGVLNVSRHMGQLEGKASRLGH